MSCCYLLCEACTDNSNSPPPLLLKKVFQRAVNWNILKEAMLRNPYSGHNFLMCIQTAPLIQLICWRGLWSKPPWFWLSWTEPSFIYPLFLSTDGLQLHDMACTRFKNNQHASSLLSLHFSLVMTVSVPSDGSLTQNKSSLTKQSVLNNQLAS